jgi:hypothetical protein
VLLLLLPIPEQHVDGPGRQQDSRSPSRGRPRRRVIPRTNAVSAGLAGVVGRACGSGFAVIVHVDLAVSSTQAMRMVATAAAAAPRHHHPSGGECHGFLRSNDRSCPRGAFPLPPSRYSSSGMQRQSTVLRTDLGSPLNEPQRLSVSGRGRFDSIRKSESPRTGWQLKDAPCCWLYCIRQRPSDVHGFAIVDKVPCRCQFTNPRSTGQAESGECAFRTITYGLWERVYS